MTDMSGEPHVFTAHTPPSLRRLGFRGGQVAIRLESAQLAFAGEGAASLAWPVAAIGRLRIGSEEMKYGRYYQTMVWRTDTGTRLTLVPHHDQHGAYSATVRALAAQIATAGGRVERGVGLGSALLAPLLFALVFCAAAAVALFALTEEPWWGRLLVVAVPLLLLLVTLYLFLARTRPRRVATLEEIEQELPVPPGRNDRQ